MINLGDKIYVWNFASNNFELDSLGYIKIGTVKSIATDSDNSEAMVVCESVSSEGVMFSAPISLCYVVGTGPIALKSEKPIIEEPKPSQSILSIFDLEQSIMNCWNVVDDIDDVAKYIMEDPFFEGMDPKHMDKIANLLLGMNSLYQLKFDKNFKIFENVAREYHDRVRMNS